MFEFEGQLIHMSRRQTVGKLLDHLRQIKGTDYFKVAADGSACPSASQDSSGAYAKCQVIVVVPFFENIQRRCLKLLAGPMQIFVKFPDGEKVIAVDVTSTTRVGTIKQAVYKQGGPPPKEQTLKTVQGQTLHGSSTVRAANIMDGLRCQISGALPT